MTIGRRPHRTALLLLLSACHAQALRVAVDLDGSSLTPEPANVAAGATPGTTVTFLARSGSGAAAGAGSLEALLDVPGCTIGDTWLPLGAGGQLEVAVANCSAGQHPVHVTVRSADLAARQLVATTQINAYVGGTTTAAGAPPGTPLNLVVALGFDYVGTVHFESTDAAATLPPDTALAAAAHGQALLPAALVLRTPGPQTVRVVDQARGTLLTTVAFTVAAAAGPATDPPAGPTSPAAGAPVLSLVLGSGAVVADGASTANLVALVQDAQGTAIAGAPVQLTVSGSRNDLGAASGTTNAAGVWTTTLRSTFAEFKQVVAHSGAGQATGTVHFVPGPAAAATSWLSAYPDALPANGSAQSVLRFTLRDAHSNRIGGAAVTLSSSGPQAVFAPAATQVTDVNGWTSVVVTDAAIGRRTLTATAGGVSKSVAVNFTAPTTSCPVGAHLGSLPMVWPWEEPTSVALGNFDQDDWTDLAVVSAGGDGPLQIYRGNGRGSFLEAPLTYSAAGLASPQAVVFADLDHDAFLDLVVAYRDSENVAVYRNPGDGTLAPPTVYPVNLRVQALRLADLNGDGWLDVLAAGGTTPGVAIYLGAPTAALGTPQTVLTTGIAAATDLVLGDLNGDGKADLCVVDAANDQLMVLLGAGDGTFGPPQSKAVGGSEPASVALVDLDEDGHLDVAIGLRASHAVAVLRGDGTGQFGGAQLTALPAIVQGMVATDLDGDGHQDLLTLVDAAPAQLTWLPGLGTGAFGAPVRYGMPNQASHASPMAIAVGEVTRDAHPDVAVALAGSNRLAVLAGQAGTNPLERPDAYPTGMNDFGMVVVRDLNGDGRLDAVVNSAGSDSAVLLGQNGGTFGPPVSLGISPDAEWPAVGDLDGDGKLDLVFGHVPSSQVIVLLGHGDGTFAGGVDIPAAGSPRQPTLADLDGDGRLDILVGSANDAQNQALSVLFGRGDGTFAAAVTYPADFDAAYTAVADFDDDGIPDVATATSYWAYPGTISIYPGLGGGALGERTSFATGGWLFSLLARDFDGDGAVDLMTASRPDRSVYLYRGLNDGTFAAPTTLDSECWNANFLDAGADVDGDGNLDVVVACNDEGTVHLLPGHGDGTFSTPKFYQAGASNPTHVALADLDGDGRSEVLVGTWGSGSLFVLRPSCLSVTP